MPDSALPEVDNVSSQLIDSLIHKLKAKDRLVTVVRELSLAKDLDTVMQIVRLAARDLTRAAGATFVLREGNYCYYAEENAISPLWKGQRFPLKSCISGWTMINRKVAIIQDIYQDPRIPHDAYRPTFVQSLVMVPVRKDDPIAAIGCYWAEQRIPTEDEVELLQALADTTAITLENIQIYKKLEGEEEQFRTFANNIQNLAWMAEPDGWIYWYNQQWYDYTGTTFEEIQGWGWEKVHHPDHIKRVLTFVQEAWSKCETWELTFPLRGADGKYRWFLTRACAIKDENDQVIRWIGTNTNIDDRKRAEDALQYQNYLTQSITDNATVGLFMMDVNGICTFMNPAAEEISGYSWEELKQHPEKNLHDWVHFLRPDGSPYPVSECPIDRALPENNDMRAHEDIFVRCDGTFYNVSCAARPIIKDGVPVGTLVEVRDITEQKQAEEELLNYARLLERSNKELEQFATIASHDLQEPLRKVMVFGDMLMPFVSPEGQDYLNRMVASTHRMQDLISDLLMLSRVNRKGKPFDWVDLNEVVKTVVDDLQIAIREAEATVTTELLDSIYGDESQIRQLVQNLIGNALKYRRREVPPDIRIYGQFDKGAYCVTIADNGIGIGCEYYERIFEPFQRLHGKDHYSGTGMGLTICKKIVERHNGTITVESKLGKGSCFLIRLPFELN